MKTELPVNQLKDNAIFQLSLSSKELFHSNLLFWIANDSNPQVQDLLCTILTECFKIPAAIVAMWKKKGWIAKREYKNFDFCLCEKSDFCDVENGQILLIVENKCKSMPNYAQLKGYVDNVEGSGKKKGVNYEIVTEMKRAFNQSLSTKSPSRFVKSNEVFVPQYVLLTMVDDFVDKQAIEKDGRWTIATYSEYAKCIKQWLNQHATDKSISSQSTILSQYVEFVSAMAKDLSTINTDISAQSNWLDVFNNQAWNDVRLGDLWQKSIANHLARMIGLALQGKDVNIKYQLSAKQMLSADGSFIAIETGYSRGHGSITIRKKISDTALFNIQIQGNQYRRCLEVLTPNHADSVLQSQLPILSKFNLQDKFCRFGNIFIYQYDKLTNESIEQVIDKIKKDL